MSQETMSHKDQSPQKPKIFRGLTAEDIYGPKIAAQIEASCKTAPRRRMAYLKSDYLEMRAEQTSSRKLP